MPGPLQEGVERLRQGNAVGAVLHLERAMFEDPADPRVWLSLAAAYEESHQPDRAIHAWKEAARLSPESAAARYCLGLALERAGDPAAAVAALAAALRLQPQHARARAALRRVEALAGPPAVPAAPSPAPLPAVPSTGTDFILAPGFFPASTAPMDRPDPRTPAERGAALAAALEQMDEWALPGVDEPSPPPLSPPRPPPPAPMRVPAEAPARTAPAPVVTPLADAEGTPVPPWRSPMVLAGVITAGLVLLLVVLIARSLLGGGPAGRYVERSLDSVRLTLDREGRFVWTRQGKTWRAGRYTLQGRELRLTPDARSAGAEELVGSVEPDGFLQFGPETYVRDQE